jgi:glycosyltransferase involved in cell wall biosynthesis
VASAAGGLVDIVDDGCTGLLVPPGDVDPLHDALKSLLDNPERREQMGRAGLDRVKMFQAESVVTRIEAAYQTVLNKKTAHAAH